jgi:predicted amidohydrolase YtcJ
MSLDAIAAARAATGNANARDMITHLQLVDPLDLPRFAALGVSALPQPYWFGKDELYANLYVSFLGVERADHQYPMRSFWDHGVPVASASDYPVSPPPNPLLAIQRGVLRRRVDEPGACAELWPEEAVSVEQMIESFTISGAYANFLEDETGSIEVGKSADLVVLSENILEMPPELIHQAEVLLTVFRGVPVSATGPFAGLAPD